MNTLILEEKNKTLSSRILFYAFKWLSAFLISFTLATVLMAIVGFGVWSFIFSFIAFQAILWKIIHKANLIFVMIVDAVFVVAVIAIQLYITLGQNF